MKEKKTTTKETKFVYTKFVATLFLSHKQNNQVEKNNDYLCAISLANNLHLMLKFAYNQYLLKKNSHTDTRTSKSRHCANATDKQTASKLHHFTIRRLEGKERKKKE